MRSIRSKIFFGCISLTFVAVLIGLLSQNTQSKLSDMALGIYDDAFQSMSYLRAAQSTILSISRNIAVGETDRDVFIDQLQSALDALDVADERAMSPAGEAVTKDLKAATSSLQSHIRNATSVPARAEFQAVESLFDKAVAISASDGFRLRRSAEALVKQTRVQTYAAIIGSVVITFVITLLLSHAIVPSIRQAVLVATAIASGKLDNRIETEGVSETGVLLKALAVMQASIAEKMRRIESLMAQQASSHDVAIASQNARFEIALDHMTLGLRMFDATGGLVVQNRRFTEMFGAGLPLACLAQELAARAPLDGDRARGRAAESGSYNFVMEDGRTIEVSEEAMDCGGRVVTYDDITERRRADDMLAHMVRHDVLTGLPNRVLFREHLEQEMRAERDAGALSLLCLDLDQFKTVNDTMGHPVGDELLRETAKRLLSATGDAGIVVRLGGDEFAIIQSSARRDEDARRLAERLIEALCVPFEIDGHRISIGASIGIAETTDGLETPDELLKNADLALYTVKAEGRGAYRFFEPEMNVLVQARRSLELDLREAIAEHQFELHYQPIVGSKTGAVVACEALVRWRHPQRGMVSPADFIPLAEEAGLIPEIGLWVLDQACRDATAWPSHVKVAVNLSPLQFQYRDLVSDVREALRRSGLSAKRLDLEITESTMLRNSDATLATLHDLRALGIRISMDDFGTGFSSLSYLRQFPFDKIKIDQSFIRDVVESKDGLAIVKAVIRLGQSLRMNVVAEGVETIEQKDLLVKAGCQELQGYLFSRPRPAGVVGDVIRRMSLSLAA